MPAPKYLTNTFIAIGVIMLAVIIVGVIFFVKPSERAPQVAQQETHKEPPAAPLAFDGEWVAAEFPLEYHHSYNMQVPSTWDFSAGGDMDHASVSTITPPDSEYQAIVVDFALVGCPDAEQDCTLEEVVPIPADEFMRRQVAFMETVDTLESTDSLTLPNITEPARIYRGISTSGQSRDISLIQLPKGVILIEFQPAEMFGEALKNKMLESITAHEE